MKSEMAILTDVTRCTGCEECVRACKQEYGLGEDLARRWKESIDSLSSTRYTTIVRKPGNHFVRQLCRHCNEPACVSACIVGALQKTPEGPVIYDSDLCMGCRYCMMACPYGIPRYDWEKPVPFVRKCILCYPRLAEGRQPACTEACPYEATIFGPRDELIAEAHRRLRLEPGRYVQRVYGEHEVGGTSVLYISDIPLDFLAFKPDLGDEPLPELTLAALSKVPYLSIGMAGAMTGIWWIIGRRMKLAAEAAARPESGAASTDTGERDPGE
jgi:formate dehydrogenase iron-sulfur subunit